MNGKASFLLGKLRKIYGIGGSLFLEEVSYKNTNGNVRRIDAMSYGIKKSRGCFFTGFEIKVDRQDWLNELCTHEKAEAFRPYIFHFYLVAWKGVVEKHEIPAAWGFLEWNGKRLEQVKAAPENNDVQIMPNDLLAAFFGRILKQEKLKSIQLIKQRIATREENLEKEIEKRIRESQIDKFNLRKREQAFCQQLGITKETMAALENSPERMEIIRGLIHGESLLYSTEVENYAYSLMKGLERYEGYSSDAKKIYKEIKTKRNYSKQLASLKKKISDGGAGI